MPHFKLIALPNSSASAATEIIHAFHYTNAQPTKHTYIQFTIIFSTRMHIPLSKRIYATLKIIGARGYAEKIFPRMKFEETIWKEECEFWRNNSLSFAFFFRCRLFLVSFHPLTCQTRKWQKIKAWTHFVSMLNFVVFCLQISSFETHLTFIFQYRYFLVFFILES